MRAAPALAAQPVDLSLAGYSGLIGTPHAEVLAEGTLAAAYSNFDATPSLSDSSIYAIGIGLFERVELDARLVESTRDPITGSRIGDLSAGLKLQLFKKAGWPSLTVGGQDLQGNQILPTYYAVSSWGFYSFRLSGGYGWKSESLDGFFGGLEWLPARWFSITAEHAPENDRVGARLTAPLIWGAALSGLVARELSEDKQTFFGVELSLPLAGPPPKEAEYKRRAGKRAAADSTPTDLNGSLRKAGLVATEVATTGGRYTVCVDDALRYRAPIDALGVALDLVSSHVPARTSEIRVVLKRDSYPLLLATATPEQLAKFFRDAGALAPHVEFAPPAACDFDAPALIQSARSARPVELVLEPNLVTFIGTEYGALDADVSLRARLQIPLFRGTELTVSALSPSARSSDFDDGRNFSRQASKAGLDQALLQWYAHPSSRWHSLISLGHMRLFQKDTAALLHENVIYSRDGSNTARLYLGLFRPSDGENRSVGVLEVGHVFSGHDLALNIAGGRFAAGDSGGRIELTRFFGDSSVTLFVKSAGSNGVDTAGGMRLAIPLSFRFRGERYGFAVRGAERWSHSAQSTFGGSSGENSLRPNLLVEPLPDRNLRDTYLDVDRATPDWIDAHLDRLRDAPIDESMSGSSLFGD